MKFALSSRANHIDHAHAMSTQNKLPGKTAARTTLDTYRLNWKMYIFNNPGDPNSEFCSNPEQRSSSSSPTASNPAANPYRTNDNPSSHKHLGNRENPNSGILHSCKRKIYAKSILHNAIVKVAASPRPHPKTLTSHITKRLNACTEYIPTYYSDIFSCVVLLWFRK